MDAVKGGLEVGGHAPARLGEDAQLAALREHLRRGDGAVVDGPLANGDVHRNKLDAKLGGLGGGNVAAGLSGDDDLCHGWSPRSLRAAAGAAGWAEYAQVRTF